ncbi:MAG: methyltransferase [Syntrophomonadaceae bacterium]|jgi:tRNA1Val (adenine37-N6)-methyltransferase|nr:methyltransferase [Syntrophomonadaceae bacterium]
MKIIQPRQGYRFSIDSILLAFFADARQAMQAVDLGTGSGVIPLLLAYQKQDLKIIGIEIMPEAADRARRSATFNGLANRIAIIHGDIKNIKSLLPPGLADLVVANPPFWKKGEGRLSQNLEQAVARHELKVELSQIVSAAAYLLTSQGRLCMIHRADRADEIMSCFAEHELRQIKIRWVHSFPERPPHLLLIEGQKNPSPKVTQLAPLIIYRNKGEYSQEIKRIYEENPGCLNG